MNNGSIVQGTHRVKASIADALGETPLVDISEHTNRVQ